VKIKTIFILAVAVACGTAGSRLTKRLFSKPVEAHDASSDRIVVFAAKQALTPGTVLREPDRLFEERILGSGEVPSRAVRRLHQLRGRRLIKALDANTIVTADCLAEEEEEGPERLKREGRRAVAVPVQAIGPALFLPQSRVDIVWTVSGPAAESRIVAQDLPLLGVQPDRDGKTIATVAAKREDAEKLAQAATQGTLRLVPPQPR
jgi:Flp pilus assembly protein CpaB